MFSYYLAKFYVKINFKIKIDPKMCTFKNLGEILKTWKKFSKNKWQTCNQGKYYFLLIIELKLSLFRIVFPKFN